MRFPPRSSAWQTLPVWLLLLVVLAACGERPSVLVVGIDGGDWDVIDPLVREGYLPTIGGIVEAGARADMDCAPAWPVYACYCPPVWVSVATGVASRDHKIRQLTQRSDEREAKTIWNVVADHGGSSTILSWRNTWPPDEPGDWVISEPGTDLLAFESYAVWPTEGGAPGYEDVENHAQPSFLPELLGLRPAREDPRPTWWIFGRDRIAMAALERILLFRRFIAPEVGPADLTMILLHSPDKVEHIAWGAIQFAPNAPIHEANLFRGADLWDGPIWKRGPYGIGAVANQYQEIDAWLGRLLEWAHFDYIVFVSDHGMGRNPNPGTTGHHTVDMPESHAGIFSITGPGVRAGAVLDDITVLDVAPTLAYVLGLPIARDIAGVPVFQAFQYSQLAQTPPRFAGSW